jgi:hypothetical protein
VLSYKRKITYFYEHHNQNVGTTAGFLKLEIRGDKVKIMLNIQEPAGLPYQEAGLYFYHEAGDHLAAIKVENLTSNNGMLAYQNRTEWQNVYGTNRDLYTFDGVAVVYNATHYYIGDFNGKDRREYPLVFKQEQPDQVSQYGQTSTLAAQPIERKKEGIKTEQPASDSWYETVSPPEANTDVMQKPDREADADAEQKPTRETNTDTIQKPTRADKLSSESVSTPQDGLVYSKCQDCPYQKKRQEQQESKNAFEEMIAQYPKLPMYGAAELFDCVRIHPKDIGKLDMRNWKLGVNSFLTHGFYTYQYLLLGKMRFDNGRESQIIGVPGVYSNRERYLANMFGFEQFIPIKKTGMKTGQFGYWIVELQ